MLADPEAYEPNNHGLFVDFGLALLSDYAGFFPESAGWDNLARYRFRNTVAGRLHEEEGVWLEHSAGYQLLAIDLVAEVRRQLRPGRVRRGAGPDARGGRLDADAGQPDGPLR